VTGSALHRVVSPTTTASADFCQPSRQADRPPRVRRATFIPHIRRIYFRTLLDGYWALDLLASSPGYGCLVCGSCLSGRDFAYSFLPTMPRDKAVAVRLVVPAIRINRGLAPPSHPIITTMNGIAPIRRYAPCLAHQKKAPKPYRPKCLIHLLLGSNQWPLPLDKVRFLNPNEEKAFRRPTRETTGET
jgi:hypothetical protein